MQVCRSFASDVTLKTTFNILVSNGTLFKRIRVTHPMKLVSGQPFSSEATKTETQS